MTRADGTRGARHGAVQPLQKELSRLSAERADLPFDFQGGFVGYLGYELKHDCGASAPDASPDPDAGLVLTDRLLVWDHAEHELYLVALAPERR